LLKNGGTLLRKVSKNFTSTQMILAVAALAVVSIVVVKKAADAEGEKKPRRKIRTGSLPYCRQPIAGRDSWLSLFVKGLKAGDSLERAAARGRYVAEYQVRDKQRHGILRAGARWPGVVGAVLVSEKYGLPRLRLAAEVVDGCYYIGSHDFCRRSNLNVDGLADGRGTVYLDEYPIHAGSANDYA
nr:hypothetical protein [Tanacetum cinerariifolium]